MCAGYSIWTALPIEERHLQSQTIRDNDGPGRLVCRVIPTRKPRSEGRRAWYRTHKPFRATVFKAAH